MASRSPSFLACELSSRISCRRWRCVRSASLSGISSRPRGGVTGLLLLAESHLACHTFPEHQSICLNVFCCQPRPDWDFAGYFKREFGATLVNVRRIERPYTHERETRQLSELRRANQVPLV